MKDNLFEMLLSLFEKSLSRLQKSIEPSANGLEPQELLPDMLGEEVLVIDDKMVPLNTAKETSTRILTSHEQMKLTKASYQFLMKMKLARVLDPELFESILNQLQFSDSRIVTLKETKWTIRNSLATHLSENQLAFLDLVLYQEEDKPTKH